MGKETKEKIKNLPFISLKTLQSINEKDISPFLKYQKKIGNVLRLKRGMYVFEEFVKKETLKGEIQQYLEFLANKLIQPSYLSLDYVLSKYSLIPEGVYGLTSITLKTPRKIKNDLGLFSYRKIKNSLFCGYKIYQRGNYFIQEASKSKALFDFLYFQKRGLEKIDKSFIGELRLNLDEMKKSDWQEFFGYVKLSRSKKMRKIFKLVSIVK